MAYNPSIFTVQNSPTGIAQAVPTDARSMFYDAGNFIFRPYQSIAEANTYLAVSKFRAGKFSLYMNTTGTLNGNGTYTGGAITEYWYKDGITDGDLVLKPAAGVFIGTPDLL